MGEAKRRREAAKLLPDDIKADIAAIVQQQQNSFTVFDGQGQPVDKGQRCLWQALVGHVTLDCVGIATRLVTGHARYRFAPGDVLDLTVHFWLMAGDQLIDFSVVEWRDTTRGECDPAWHVAPPRYHWGDRAQFTCSSGRPEELRTSPQLPPPLGVAWYFGFVDRPTLLRQLRDSFRAPLLSKLTPLLAQADLIERVKACTR
jgi:hypothetical protein